MAVRVVQAVAILIAQTLGGAESGAGNVVIPGVDARWGQRLEQAREAGARGDGDEAAAILQTIIAEGDAVLLPVDEGVRYVPASNLAREALLRLPAAGLAAYRRLHDGAAEALLRRARESGDERAYERVAALYPVTEAAAAAQGHLAEAAFEAGSFRVAASIWRRLLAEHPGGPSLEAALRPRLDACALAIRAERPAPSRRPVLWDAVRPEDAVASLPFASGRVVWKSDHWSDRVDPLTHLGGARFDPMVYRFPLHFEFFPEPVPACVLMSGVWEVHGIDHRTGKDDYGWQKPRRAEANIGGEPYREGSWSFVAETRVVDRILITSTIDAIAQAQQYMGYTITCRIPRRGLVAIDTVRGGVLWDTASIPDLAELSFPGPFAIRGDRLYAGAWSKSGYIDAYVVAIDLREGRTLWKTLLASNQLELTIFGEMAVEPFATAIAERDGILYAAPHLGACAALDARDGRVLWTTLYEAVKIPSTRSRFPIARRLDWAHAPIILDGERLYVAPRDSLLLLAIEAESGRILNAWENEPGMRELLGLWEGRLYATGRAGVYALSPRETAASWVRLWGAPSGGGAEIYGRGQLCDRGVIFSTAAGLLLLEHGERAPRLLARYQRSSRTEASDPPVDAGNVRVYEDRVYVASRQSLGCYVRDDRGDPDRDGADGRTSP
ncbi:MAG: PQQ-binding-like beta-propeller repeat protein [Planctomycetes bacterium]|nr:PQQ-binding-like beta-propeller repeat protein [Planctomycetota bacterium]